MTGTTGNGGVFDMLTCDIMRRVTLCDVCHYVTCDIVSQITNVLTRWGKSKKFQLERAMA